VIISGGENISSIELEDVLYRHPAVLVAAVVAKPDAKWGEVPCAFVEVRDPSSVTEADILDHCRAHAGRLQGAQAGGVRPAAQNFHRQDPEICAA